MAKTNEIGNAVIFLIQKLSYFRCSIFISQSNVLAQNQNSNVNGGIISTNDNTSICIDSEADPINVYVAGDSGSFPGPGWLPKQAHMADLQAETAVKNLLSEFSGQVPSEKFKVELMCIVDSQDKGMLVFRDMNRSLIC